MNNSLHNTYFDNATTSFPKLESVAREMSRYLNEVGGSYGRSSHGRTLACTRMVENARDLVADLMSCSGDNVFFTPGATFSLNTVIYGLLENSEEVLISPLEHNAVMRPLDELKSRRNIKVRIMPHFSDGRIDVSKLGEYITSNTSLVVVNHQSNVNGVIQDIKAIKQAIKDIPILLDGAQSLGSIPVLIDESNIDYFAFTAHKSLLGPPGIGGLFVRNPESLPPLIMGGTGSNSEFFSMPEVVPDKFEAGTQNIAGIFGLNAALNSPRKILHSMDEFFSFLEQVSRIKNMIIYCAEDRSYQGQLFSLNSTKMDCAALGRNLLEEFNIETRVGLHCSPLAHKTISSFPEGSVRIAPSIFHTSNDFDYVLYALEKIANR